MKDEKSYDVILFKAVSYALKAEKILKKESLPHKLIPVPKHISSDCGVCLMIHLDVKDQVLTALKDKVDIESVRPLAD
jgi:hypothetical protein